MANAKTKNVEHQIINFSQCEAICLLDIDLKNVGNNAYIYIYLK